MTETPRIEIRDVPAYMAVHVVQCAYGRLRAVVGRYGERLAFRGVLDAAPWPALVTEVEVDPYEGCSTICRTDYVDPPTDLGPGSGVYWTTICHVAQATVRSYLTTEPGTALLRDHLEKMLQDFDDRILEHYGRATPPDYLQPHRAKILRALVRRMVDDAAVIEVADGLAGQWALPQSVDELIEAAGLILQDPRSR